MLVYVFILIVSSVMHFYHRNNALISWNGNEPYNLFLNLNISGLTMHLSLLVNAVMQSGSYYVNKFSLVIS